MGALHLTNRQLLCSEKYYMDFDYADIVQNKPHRIRFLCKFHHMHITLFNFRHSFVYADSGIQIRNVNNDQILSNTCVCACILLMGWRTI